MKRKHFLFILTSILLLTALIVGSILLVQAASEKNVQNGTGNRGAVRVSDTFAYRAKVNGEFTAFSYTMPTWTETDSAATLSLYKWTGEINTSLEAEPIATQRF
ncbi:MAG: hypothetical protein IJX72_05550, partial [Clostridia bacterium]|nr:hypothetical protein [Clostridia bacterium]